MSTIILICAIVLYILISSVVLVHTRKILLMGCTLNVLGVLVFANEMTMNTPLVGLGCISFGVSLVVLISSKNPKMYALVRPGSAIAALLLTIGLFSPNSSSMALPERWWINVHVTLFILGYAGFTIAALVGGVYVIVQSRLKQRSLQGIAKYPALNTLDVYNFWCTLIGFAGLLTGVLAGIFWAFYNNTELSWDVTFVSSFILLVWYAIALTSRFFGRQGRWAAWFSVLGFSSLTIFFFLTSVVGNWHMG
jgi:ABC-type uncharacterized transport system permease subunit